MGETLWVSFPPTIGKRGHTIHLPATVDGLALALGILRERQTSANTVATLGAPVQYDIERIAEALDNYSTTAGRKRKEAAVADELLKDLGL